MVCIGEWMENRLKKLEIAFEKSLNNGFEPENKFYEYLNDLWVIAHKLQK